jgi:hypothetical protein
VVPDLNLEIIGARGEKRLVSLVILDAIDACSMRIGTVSDRVVGGCTSSDY